MRIDDGLTPSGSAPAGIFSVNDLSTDFTVSGGDGAGTGGVVLVTFDVVVVEFVDVVLSGVVVTVGMVVLLLVFGSPLFTGVVEDVAGVVVLVLVLKLLVFIGEVFIYTCCVFVILSVVFAVEEMLSMELQDENSNRRETRRETAGYRNFNLPWVLVRPVIPYSLSRPVDIKEVFHFKAEDGFHSHPRQVAKYKY